MFFKSTVPVTFPHIFTIDKVRTVLLPARPKWWDRHTCSHAREALRASLRLICKSNDPKVWRWPRALFALPSSFSPLAAPSDRSDHPKGGKQ